MGNTDYTALARPPDPPGGTLSGYRDACPPRRHG